MTIDQILDGFLADQKERLAERTFRNYEEVVELFRRCMNDHGPSSLTGEERKRWEAAYQDGKEDAFTAVFERRRSPVG